MKWTDLSWAVSTVALSPQQIAILRILCELSPNITKSGDIAKRLVKEGYRQADRKVVSVQVHHIRKNI
ncbi:MAG: winged helix-turn-helix domain-containing protein, partial [Aestuariivirga sp.]